MAEGRTGIRGMTIVIVAAVLMSKLGQVADNQHKRPQKAVQDLTGSKLRMGLHLAGIPSLLTWPTPSALWTT